MLAWLRCSWLFGWLFDRIDLLWRLWPAENDWQRIELAIQPDHVHLFVRTTPSTLPCDIPRLIKGRSSRLLRQEFAHLRKLPTLWTHSYFLSTAGNVSSETIARYMERQSHA